MADRLLVLVVESRPALARSLKLGLEEIGIEVVIADALCNARRLLKELTPRIDAVLLEPHLPDGRGEDLLPEIAALPQPPEVVVLRHHSERIRPAAIATPAVIAPNAVSSATLARVVRIAANDYVACTLHRFARHHKLTRKETEILGHVADGTCPKRIAADSSCSLQAVYAHLARTARKASCTSYPEVVAKLFRFSCDGPGPGTTVRRSNDLRQVVSEIIGSSRTLASTSTNLPGLSCQAGDNPKDALDKTSMLPAATTEPSGDEATPTSKSLSGYSPEFRQVASDVRRAIEGIQNISAENRLPVIDGTRQVARARWSRQQLAAIVTELNELSRQAATTAKDIKASLRAV